MSTRPYQLTAVEIHRTSLIRSLPAVDLEILDKLLAGLVEDLALVAPLLPDKNVISIR